MVIDPIPTVKKVISHTDTRATTQTVPVPVTDRKPGGPGKGRKFPIQDNPDQDSPVQENPGEENPVQENPGGENPGPQPTAITTAPAPAVPNQPTKSAVTTHKDNIRTNPAPGPTRLVPTRAPSVEVKPDDAEKPKLGPSTSRNPSTKKENVDIVTIKSSVAQDRDSWAPDQNNVNTEAGPDLQKVVPVSDDDEYDADSTVSPPLKSGSSMSKPVAGKKLPLFYLFHSRETMRRI